MDATLLRTGFAAIGPRHDELAKRFWDRVLARSRRLRRRLGRRPRAELAQELIRTLGDLLGRLDDPTRLEAAASALGARAGALGLAGDLAEPVGECLLDALAEAHGSAWSLRHAIAWRRAWVEVAAAMTRGAALHRRIARGAGPPGCASPPHRGVSPQAA